MSNERVCAEIDLSAIHDNMESMRRTLSPETGMIAVIKTDGYGHGAVPIAAHIEHLPFLWGFAVATFEEARAIIVSRLNDLRCDLSDKSPLEDSIVAEICRAREDKKQSLMDLYAGYFSPCKVTDTSYMPKAETDMNELMINFSEGFKAFIQSMEEQYVNSIIRRRRATILLNRMLTIKMPCALIMYLYYYKL